MVTSLFELVNATSSGLSSSRKEKAVTGSEFLNDHRSSNYVTLEQDAIAELLDGNCPFFMKKFCPVEVGDVMYLASPDYLCLGSDEDYVRIPLSGSGAQKVIDAFQCSLPTVKMVNDIYAQAGNKLVAIPFGPPYDASMMSATRIEWINGKINGQMKGRDNALLTEGHKKNVVLTNKLGANNPSKRVAIYGWFQANGKVIQGLNPSTHEISYFDYSHGIRLIANIASVNGQLMSLHEAFASRPKVFSDEGEVEFLSY